MQVKVFDSESTLGYKQITTYFSDFSIADAFGPKAIKDTYKRGLEWAKTNYKILTEFVMVLNWKLWQHWEEGHEEIAKLYNDLWEEARNYAYKHLKGKELEYYYETTD